MRSAFLMSATGREKFLSLILRLRRVGSAWISAIVVEATTRAGLCSMGRCAIPRRRLPERAEKRPFPRISAPLNRLNLRAPVTVATFLAVTVARLRLSF